jgi:hypothetical protein
VNCQYPVYSGHDFNTIIVDNSLFYSGSYVVFGGSGSDLVIIGRHLTVHGFDKVGPHTSDLSLTNSVVVGASWGSGSVSADHTVYYPSDPGGIFQTVGAASHYLAEGSTNRDAGTTDIPASLLADLQKKTTYPPYEITTNITGNTVLSLQASRDTNTPDLGYHYDPLDYVVSGRTVSANLTLTNGVALGTYGAASSYGLGLSSGSFVSKGTPTNLNWIVRYNTVQEQSTANWSAGTVAPGVKMLSSSPAVSVRFSGWSLLGGTGDHFHGYASATTPCGFTDCQFAGGAFTMVDNSTTLTNCLWERVALTIDDDHDPMAFAAFNNLLRGGSLSLTLDKNSNEWFLKDNLFDQTAITTQGAGTITHDYNGYVINNDRLPSNGAHDVILNNTPVYLTGHLGSYYYPTADGNLSRLIDAGSRPVEDAGLPGYTVQTNQAPDLCTVDIGFHYRGASGDLIVSTNCTALDLVKLLVPVAAWGSIAKASYTGMVQARGVFTNGFPTGFPINYGVILASGDITNAIGPNTDSEAQTRFWFYDDHYEDTDLDDLVAEGGSTTKDAAVLEFDLTSTTSFTLQFRYILGSEEYPEWIAQFNDPVAIFVTTNFNGTKWVCNVTNDLAVVPGMTNLPVSVSNINGGKTNFWDFSYVAPTNPQYYVDNHDTGGGAYAAATNAAPVPVYNLQYDGFTTLQIVQTNISANVTYHIKIAIADYVDDQRDSGVFIKAQCQ